MKMKNLYLNLVATAILSVMLSSCGIFGKKNSKGSVLPNDGQVHGVAPGAKYALPKPPGMVYIPQLVNSTEIKAAVKMLMLRFFIFIQLNVNGYWQI